MKRKLLSFCVLTVLLLAYFRGDALSVPSGNNMHSRKYLVTARDLDKWSLGIFTSASERKAEVSQRDYDLDISQAVITLGYDVTDWKNLYLSGGSQDVDDKNSRYNASGGGLYAQGNQMNLLDHDIPDPSFFEDTLRLNFNLQYTVSEAKITTDEKSSWGELSGSLTANLINDNPGTTVYFPHKMVLFFGPAISLIDHKDISDETTTGFVGGLEIIVSESVSLTFGVENFDGAGFMGGLHLRF